MENDKAPRVLTVARHITQHKWDELETPRNSVKCTRLVLHYINTQLHHVLSLFDLNSNLPWCVCWADGIENVALSDTDGRDEKITRVDVVSGKTTVVSGLVSSVSIHYL